MEELEVPVLANQSNVKKLTLINKVALKELIAELAGLEETARYYNASPELQTAYAKALEDANAVYANKEVYRQLRKKYKQWYLLSDKMKDEPAAVRMRFALLETSPKLYQTIKRLL